MNKINMPLKVGAFLKGVGITSVELDEQNNLIFTLSDGTVENVGALNVDSEFNGRSTNPVQNKVIYAAVQELFRSIGQTDSNSEQRDEANKAELKALIDAVNDVLASHAQEYEEFRSYADTQLKRVSSGVVVTDNTVNSATIGEIHPISSNAVATMWRDKGYEFEALRFTEVGEYDVPSGVNNTYNAYVAQGSKVIALEGKVSISAGTYAEKVGNKLVISGTRPIAAIYYITKATPIFDLLIPSNVLRKDDVLENITAGSTLPVQSHAILMALTQKVDKVEGKGLSTNDYTNEEKAQVAENKANIATNAEQIAEHGTTLTEHGEAIAQNAEEIGGKADKNGRYDKLTSGFAANVVGDGSATEEVIGFRPTAGEERNVANTTYIDGERNEAARITAIKGNSLIYNQLVKDALSSDSSGNDGWYIRVGVSLATIDEDGMVSFVYNSSAIPQISQNVHFVGGDKYLILCYWNYPEEIFTLETANQIRIRQQSDRNGNTTTHIHTNTSEHIGYKVFFYTADGDLPFFSITLRSYANLQNKDLSFRSRTRIYNLTRMFGAGNEPTTIEELYQRMPVGVDINAYNEGELIDGHYSALRSTAFNQYNGRYAKVLAGVTYHATGDISSIGFATEEGGTTEDITLDNGKYTPTQNGYIYASGENICIHLCWSEYAHMEDMYEEYKPFVRDLSWIKKYFPNGMRSAGDVRDEIRYNAAEERWEAVQRVDRVAGEMANYALATPIVTPIEEDINLDYDCSDYGTEELISDGVSAPLVADVVYSPNALSTLKQVPDILRRLAVLEAKAVENTNVTMEE